MTNPCMDCNRRQVGCHSSCVDYIGYIEEYRDIKEQRRKESEYWGYTARVVLKRLKELEKLK